MTEERFLGCAESKVRGKRCVNAKRKCRECHNAACREWASKNAEKKREWDRRYREENREKKREWDRRYREENREARRRGCVRERERNARVAARATRRQVPWTAEEDAQAFDGSLREVASRLGRTPRAVENRRYRLRETMAQLEQVMTTQRGDE